MTNGLIAKKYLLTVTTTDVRNHEWEKENGA